MPCRNALCACRRVPRQQGAASVRSESSGEPRVCRQLWGPPLAGKPLLMHHGNLRCAVPCHGCYDSAAAPSVPGALMPVDEVSSGNCLPYPSCHSVFSLAVMQAGKCEGWHRAHAQYDFRQPLQNSTPSKWPGMRSGWDAGKGNNGGGGGGVSGHADGQIPNGCRGGRRRETLRQCRRHCWRRGAARTCGCWRRPASRTRGGVCGGAPPTAAPPASCPCCAASRTCGWGTRGWFSEPHATMTRMTGVIEGSRGDTGPMQLNGAAW